MNKIHKINKVQLFDFFANQHGFKLFSIPFVDRAFKPHALKPSRQIIFCLDVIYDLSEVGYSFSNLYIGSTGSSDFMLNAEDCNFRTYKTLLELQREDKVISLQKLPVAAKEAVIGNAIANVSEIRYSPLPNDSLCIFIPKASSLEELAIKMELEK